MPLLEKVSYSRKSVIFGATSTSIFTIGYEGKSLEEYLETLSNAGITLLCDVRRNPISRKPGFSKGALSNACLANGIKYQHLPDLGINSDKRKNLKTQRDYDLLFKMYEKFELPKRDMTLRIIEEWIKDGEKVALTCFEHHPEQCHRHCVAEALEKRLGDGYSIEHLGVYE
jgi:uncharacterized protein (DUF488 family)